VLPIGIRGAYQALPRSRRIPSPTRVRIHIGEPLVFPGGPCHDLPARAATRSFRNLLHERVRRLAGELEEVAPASLPPYAAADPAIH
jgi:1-acyl-sn-glycerol-3-phosphate acyltransferase